MTIVIDALRPRHPEKARRPDNAVPRKPDWIRVKAPVSREYIATREVVRENKLHTVCQSAQCPNLGECWSRGTATVMILGNICTRSCNFCAIATGRPTELDLGGTAGTSWALEYAPGSPHATLKRSEHSPLAAVNRLHKAVGGGTFWILLADSFAIGMLLLTLPVFFPAVMKLGYDPIWFGIVVVKMCGVCLLTPPIGLSCFVVAAVRRDIPLADVFKGALPFVIADFTAIGIFLTWPETVSATPTSTTTASASRVSVRRSPSSGHASTATMIGAV